MLTLYYFSGAASIAAHILLEESGQPYALQYVDIPAGQQRSTAYLKIHPLGRVPALCLDDGEVLTENVAILPYLGKRFGFWPKELMGEARALFYLGFFATNVHPAFAHFNRPQRFADDENAKAEVKRVGYRTFHELLEQTDCMLAGKTSWLVDDYSAVDPYALLFYIWGHKRGLPVGQMQHYTAFVKRILERPAVQRVLEQEEVDLVGLSRL